MDGHGVDVEDAENVEDVVVGESVAEVAPVAQEVDDVAPIQLPVFGVVGVVDVVVLEQV